MTTNVLRHITAQEGNMKKTTIFVLALLGLLVAAVPASAAPDTQGPIVTARNADIRNTAEAITTTSTPNCTAVEVCHDNVGDDVMHVIYASSAPTGTAAMLASKGKELYPPTFTAATGGPKCTVFQGSPYLNLANFYGWTAATTANAMSATCTKK